MSFSVMPEINTALSDMSADTITIAVGFISLAIIVAAFLAVSKVAHDRGWFEDQEGDDDWTHDPSEDDIYDDDYMDRIDALDSGVCSSCGADVGVAIGFGDEVCPECGADL